MSKYGNVKVQKDGYTFDSKAEAGRYDELKLLERNGDIAFLQVHTRFLLIEGFSFNGKKERPVYYEADFDYVENGIHVVEDVKGKRTALYKMKRKLFLSKIILPHRKMTFVEVDAY